MTHQNTYDYVHPVRYGAHKPASCHYLERSWAELAGQCCAALSHGVNRLTGKSSTLNFNCRYNAAGQRARATLLDDGSDWLYGYDALGQLTSANKYIC